MRRAPCFDVPLHHADLWAAHAARAAEVGSLATDGDRKVSGFADTLLPEIFHRFFADAPRVVDAPAPAAAARAKVHALVSDLPEFDVLRKSTTRDAASSGVATAAIASRLAATLPARLSPADADRAREALDGLKAIAGLNPAAAAALAPRLARAEKDLSDAERAAAADAHAIDDTTLRNALRGAAADAEKAIGEARAAWAVFGWGGAPSGATIPIAEGDPKVAIEVARRVRSSETLRRIVDLAGRLIHAARAKRATRTSYARSEVIGVEPTGDLARILPSEMMGLSSPIGTAALVRKLQERAALGYKLAGKERASRGPIVIVIDQSDSMNGMDRDVWAKAIALALLDAARSERRAFGVILYNDTVQEARLFARPEDADPATLLSILARRPRGNTEYAPALRQALTWIEDAERTGAPFRKADVVHITDGAADTAGASDARARADRLGVHVYGIGLGYVSEALTAWSHETAVVNDVSNDTAAVDLIFDAI